MLSMIFYVKVEILYKLHVKWVVQIIDDYRD